MAQAKIFEFAVIYHPNEDDRKRGEVDKIIVDVSRTLADSEQSVLIKASREIPEVYLDKLDRVEVAVRPF